MTFEENLLESLPKSEVKKLLSSLQEEERHALLLDTRKMSEETFLKKFPNVKKHPQVPHAFLYKKEEYDFGKLFYYDAGLYSIEEPAAMLPAFYLPVNLGDHVLDMCAAPGGKSILLAQKMKNEGVLLSNDLSYPRAKNLSQNIERMGLGNVIVTADELGEHVKNLALSFDSILLDAPCSGSAMFRKNELAKNDWTYEKVLKQSEIQKKLIEDAYALLSPGGYLMYSTCSFSKEENENVVLSFLEKHIDMKAMRISDENGFYHSKELPEGIHIYPHLYEGEGQFFVLLKKDGRKNERTPKTRNEKRFQSFLNKYGLQNRSSEIFHGTLYSLSEQFDVKNLHVLRYGIPLLEIEDKKEEPSHHLAHYLPSSSSLHLNEENAKKYLLGESFKLKMEDGWYVVSYEGLNLGFAKIAKGVLKNHYPKGLRIKR